MTSSSGGHGTNWDRRRAKDYGYSIVSSSADMGSLTRHSDQSLLANATSNKPLKSFQNSLDPPKTEMTTHNVSLQRRQPPPPPPPPQSNLGSMPRPPHAASATNIKSSPPTTIQHDADANSAILLRNIYYPDSVVPDVKAWDVFRLLPQRADEYRQKYWLQISLQCLKLIAYLVTFALLLASSVMAKGAILLMTSGIGWGGHNFTLCNNPSTIGAYTNNTIIVENKHVVKWVWSLYLAVCAPEVFCFVRCAHRVFFRNVKRPSVAQFFGVFVIETFHAAGIGLLLFKVLPGLDAVTGAMLSNCLCIVPAILTLLSRKGGRLSIVFVVLDVLSIAAQSSGFWAWPIFIPELAADAWAVPLAIFFTSLGWWENFVHHDSVFPFIRRMARISQNLRVVRSKTYALVSVWKCLVYFCALCAFVTMRMKVDELMEPDPFGAKPIRVIVWRPSDKLQVDSAAAKSAISNLTYESVFQPPSTSTTQAPLNWHQPHYQPKNVEIIRPSSNNDPVVIDASDFLKEHQQVSSEHSNGTGDDFHARRKRQAPSTAPRYADRTTKIFYTTPYDALWVAVVQILAAFFCYQCAKFSCKVIMQRLAFAAPLNLSVPFTVFLLLSFCSKRTQNNCFLTNSLPYEMFWRCYAAKNVQDFFASPQTWFWLVWLCSQIWITIHIWMPKCERLADTDRLFVMPWFMGAFIDQSLSLNRRRDDKMKIKTEEVDLEGDDGNVSNLYETIPNVHGTTKLAPSICSEASARVNGTRNADPNHTADAITKIYACATMWHETSTEMICMLKSIFRLDEDQCARRNAQKYLKVIDPDYYEFEAHIFFDDAFETNDFGEPIVNRFVKQLLAVVELAAGAVHQTNIRVKTPKKCSAPYGGRLVWTLPGRNKLIVHLKDKMKIRVRKRWSQVMYMYYLLGHKLMEKVDDVRRKETLAENTYILTLDGDVDFKPSSVHLLVDLMRKNRRLGAACGRMHPRGAGPMVWYQKFEYAIGHWFQKATEHMIGCVLCAPGCFSLFRSAALMDDDVLRRYATKAEKARDYIQYDQGEDRWLCTLLLQRGYRVEYCAASDALTYAPEGFGEFFNQRRRWVPSTVANIMDLLSSYRKVVKVNDSISIWYILYQFSMLISSVLGPGTIFLMVVGAVNISFGWETYQSLLLVLVPVAIFGAACLMCKGEIQLILAQIISALFALLMMAVIVGTALQIKKDGIYSPHAIFLVGIIISFFIAAILHPLEFSCIIPGLLYFLSIPCMYMLLIIYSICNLHIVSWGTRETKDGAEKEQAKKKSKLANLLGVDAAEAAEIDGVYSLGCGTACRLMCCLQPSALGNSPQMMKINQQLDNLTKKLEKLDGRLVGPMNRRSSLGLVSTAEKPWENQGLLLEEDEPIDDNFDVPYNDADENEKVQQSEAWLNDKSLRHAERDHLDREEDQFWKGIIEKYLYPLQMDKKHQDEIASDLVELRNKCAAVFFMLNALFILIVFLLQLQKNCLHIEWPLGPLVNRSIIPCDYYRRDDAVWMMTRLQLEPIGVVFLVFFVSLLLLQFACMLLHRFGTLSHILASTELFCVRKSLDKLSEDELVVQNAVEIVRELQAIKGIDEDGSCGRNDEEQGGISRRSVVKSLESSRKSMMKRRTETLDAAFKKRFFALSSENGNNWNPTDVGGQAAAAAILANRGSSKRKLTLSKGTIRALEMRRNSVFGTLDHDVKNPYASRTNGNNEGGTRRRGLDRLFPDKSSSDDENQKPASAGVSSSPAAAAADETWLEKENPVKRAVKAAASVVNPSPIRKFIQNGQNVWTSSPAAGVLNQTPSEQRSGLLASSSRQSSTSSGSHDNLESRF